MPQREMFEENGRRPIHERPAQSFTAADDVDEATFVQRLQHTPDRHAADLLDIRATDGLAVRDDGERLQCGGGESLWPRCELCALDRFGVLSARENLPAPRDL